MRNELTSKNGGRVFMLYLLYRIKHSDAINGALLDTHFYDILDNCTVVLLKLRIIEFDASLDDVNNI